MTGGRGAGGRFPVPGEVAGREGAFALFSDGACRGNPGPGAWGAMAQDHGGRVLFEASGGEERTTNNRMELTGALEALRRLRAFLGSGRAGADGPAVLYSDSKYVVDGVTLWVPAWRRRGWRKADRKVPENGDLWRELDGERAAWPDLRFLWVKGHSGHPQNERCDGLANAFLDGRDPGPRGVFF